MALNLPYRFSDVPCARVLGKRKDVLDDAPALVEIMQGLMDEMRAALAADDAVAVDRTYNQMVRQMDEGAMDQTDQPHATTLP